MDEQLKQEIKQYIKENLRIEINHEKEWYWDNGGAITGFSTNVELYLEDELFCKVTGY